ncbi:hypothetical protein H0H87_005275 [Tephrocybe sp. NHM501043]|nr:hypothetical protein H0H87_005275 [Tephrocybe sp. NHM501043]
MVRASGKKVIGVIKEKDLAQKEMDAAIAQGHAAALGEELAKDVFSITVGNIGPNETVTVNLSYIDPLIDDESKYRGREALKPQLRFTVPRAYMQRAGQAPTGKFLSGVHPTDVPFTMKIFIEQVTQIIDYRTPGYNPSETWGPVGDLAYTADEEERERFLTLTFPSSTSNKDVVVIIKADGIGKPRAFIERHPSHNPPTAALALTLVPARSEYVGHIDMEYIAIVDLSNSMQGVKLEMMQKALEYLLGQLPQRGTFFNIFSYGEKVEAMWKEARTYDDIEVERAKSYIADMKANFGATKQTSKALQEVFESLPSTLARPVSIFLLTDGAAWDVKECIATTEAAIQARSTRQNFMRIFTVGLGDGVSTETCDGIARAGRGMATYIVTAEQSFLGKCVRLVLAARTPPVTSFKIFWEEDGSHQGAAKQPKGQGILSLIRDDGERPSNVHGNAICIVDGEEDDNDGDDGNGGDDDSSEDEEFRPPRDVGPLLRARQAPKQVPFLNGTRTSVFAIVPLSILTRRDYLKVQITMESIDLTVTMKLPVRLLGHSRRKTFLHTLAAKALIIDLEDLNRPSNSPTLAAESKRDIVRYGTKYGLTSQFTSFLAVDNNGPVGIANDVFGTVSVVPRSVSTLERQAASSYQPRTTSFQPRTASFSTASHLYEVASISVVDPSEGEATAKKREPDDPAILFELSSLQSVDGGFSADNVHKVIGLVLPFCPQYAMQALEGFEAEVLAAFLAWLWMTLWCGNEASTMTEKVDAWIRTKAGSHLNVDAIQQELYHITN